MLFNQLKNQRIRPWQLAVGLAVGRWVVVLWLATTRDRSIPKARGVYFFECQSYVRASAVEIRDTLSAQGGQCLMSDALRNLRLSPQKKRTDRLRMHTPMAVWTRFDLHLPGIEPGAGRWQRPILPLNYKCLT